MKERGVIPPRAQYPRRLDNEIQCDLQCDHRPSEPCHVALARPPKEQTFVCSTPSLRTKTRQGWCWGRAGSRGAGNGTLGWRGHGCDLCTLTLSGLGSRSPHSTMASFPVCGDPRPHDAPSLPRLRARGRGTEHSTYLHRALPSSTEVPTEAFAPWKRNAVH